MDINHLTRDADDLIRKVVARYNQLYIPSGNISQVELDLLLDDLRKLYDTFKNIGQVNLTLQNSKSKPEVSVRSTVPAEPYHKAVPDNTFVEKSQSSSEPTPNLQHTESELNTEPETSVKDEKNADFVTEQEFQTEFTSTYHETEKTDIEKPIEPGRNEMNAGKSSDSAPATLADMFNTGNKSLSETMSSARSQEAVSSRLLLHPISDLSSGIGLNDKFSFINELFSNNPAQYEEAIARINKAVNLDEANWILKKYHTTAWDLQPETLVRLKDFVKRRFI